MKRNHLPPIVNTPDVQLEFQLDRPLRPVVERLKSISPVIYLDGCMTGELVLRIDSENVAIRTFYDKLIPRFNDAHDGDNDDIANGNYRNPQQGKDSSKKCTLKVDSKKLSATLQWQSSMLRGSVSSYILCMIENEMMVVHVVLNPEDVGFFTYYIPVHYMSPDMMEFG